METSTVRLHAVSVVLGGTPVLRDIEWTVASHERWVVLGSNGAGKTTLLRLLALYLHPMAGTAEILGQVLGRCDVRTLRRRIAYVSGALAASLQPSMTAAQVVMTGRDAALAPWWHHYDDADRARAQDLLVRFGCGALADHTFPSLSAGEQQRTLLARAFAQKPGLLLLDEPTAGLDVGGREQLIAHLTGLADDATTPPVVMVTHHLEEIPPRFTHALALRAGLIVASGPIAEVLTDGVLSECFGLRLRVEHSNGRFAARMA